MVYSGETLTEVVNTFINFGGDNMKQARERKDGASGKRILIL